MAISRGSSLRIQGLQELYGLGDEAWTSSGQGHALVSPHISFKLPNVPRGLEPQGSMKHAGVQAYGYGRRDDLGAEGI